MTAMPQQGVIPSREILRFHDETAVAFFRDGARLPAPDGVLWAALADNHDNNMQLWAQEDQARRRHVPDSAIAANKRAIDRFNQARNDAVERMDEIFTARVGQSAPATARLNSETPGSIIDRLSIASLKIYHMGLQCRRTDVDAAHRETCIARWDRLRGQRADLAACLDDLLADCLRGAARFGLYRQFKMYNDPRLNMALVEESRRGDAPRSTAAR